MPDTARPLLQQLAQFAAVTATTAHGVVHYRSACPPGVGGPVTHVLLHGIGSASGSWLAQLAQARSARSGSCHVLAWDAPGYGGSTALPMEMPCASDYAQQLWAWLDAVVADCTQPVTLVGHSLGALMAAAAAVQQPTRVRRLVLLAPAQGYAAASAALREQKLSARLANLAQFGPAGMAARRAAAMLSPHASAEQVAFVQQVMAGIEPHGYAQAARMLSTGDVAVDLMRLQHPLTIASGAADTITPAPACRALALQVGATYLSLGDVGHSCALEAGAQVNALLGIGAVAA